MPIKKQTVGTGITAKEETVYEWPLSDAERQEEEEHWREWGKKPWGFSAWSKEMEQHCREVLEQAGVKLELWKAPAIEQPDSEVSYAYRCLQALDAIKLLVKNNHVDQALVEAIRLGALLREAMMKFRWEKDALLGTDVRARRSKGGRTRAMDVKQEKAQLRKKIRYEAGVLAHDHEDREIAGVLARKYNLSSRQIRNILKI